MDLLRVGLADVGAGVLTGEGARRAFFTNNIS